MISDMTMETACFVETLVTTYESIRRHNPQDQHGYLHRCENLKSHRILYYFRWQESSFQLHEFMNNLKTGKFLVSADC
jgi:hypothetical protein